jgi:putative intracellular protease/amidase
VVGDLLHRQEDAGGLIGCICAATTVLKSHGIKLDSRVTSHPSVMKQLVKDFKYDDVSRVVVDGNLVTSRGPGTVRVLGSPPHSHER